MRKIGTFPDRRAEKFADYLTAEGMPANVQKTDEGSYNLWVVDEDHWEQCKAQFEEFLADPDADKYNHAGKVARDIRREERVRQERVRQRVRVGKQVFSRRTPITFICLGICVLLSLVTEFQLGLQPVTRALLFNCVPVDVAMEAGWLTPETIADMENGSNGTLELRAASLLQGELWRVVTPAFLHSGIRHLLFNMLVLVYFGRRVEWREGRWFMIGLVLAGAAIPNLLQGLMSGAYDGTRLYLGVADEQLFLYSPFAGFSGVDFAIVTFMWLRGLYRLVPDYQMSQLTLIMFLAVLFLGIAGLDEAVLGANVANWAHGGGVLVGLVAAMLPIGRTSEW